METIPENKLTVIIPVYNRESVVSRTLESISAQTTHAFEVILVDNASSDGTRRILEEWAATQPFGVRVLTNERRGAAATRQYGAAAASTEWLLFFDSDDLMHPTHIERALRGIDSNPSADMIGWDLRQHFPGYSRSCPFWVTDMDFHSLFNGSTGSARYCVRRTIYEQAGGWCPDVRVWDDIELGARLLKQKPKVVKLKGTCTVDVFVQRDSMSNGESADNIGVLDLALNRIADTLGPDYAHWIWLKRIIVAAVTPGEEGTALYRQIMTEASNHRAILRLAYHYTRRGGRGIARILRLCRLI